MNIIIHLKEIIFKTVLFFVLCSTAFSCNNQLEKEELSYDIIIVGGGASGTMAGIQAARMGKKTLIVEETAWLGGMLSSAGVSAIDGNYKLPSGLWEEFRQEIYQYYGGADSVKTGWVSNVLFEPDVAAKILKNMAEEEENLKVMFYTTLDSISKIKEVWIIDLDSVGHHLSFQAKVIVDATELGDIAKLVGIPYDIGMDSRYETHEEIAPEKANNIIQDLTYVVILQEFSKDQDKTIERPKDYDSTIFECTCAGICDQDSIDKKLWDCDQMLRYGRLPNNKIMINWPIYGNDYYLNVLELTPDKRKEQFELAKWFTKCYVYYIQTELGYKHFGIAEDVFPTEDGFPMIPYHRESRRIKGLVQFTINDLSRPFQQETALYRTGIAVGDYPIDHHHGAYPKYEQLPDLHFYPVPSYGLPLGTLIPENTDDFIVAEKSISVTNLVNGTTRLQPVCLLIGQVAGTLAALSVDMKITPSKVPVRDVQNVLLDHSCYIMPYADISIEDPAFKAIQRIGSTGILKGEGKNIGWENMTLFYPDSLVSMESLSKELKEILPNSTWEIENEYITIDKSITIAQKLSNLLQDFYSNIEPIGDTSTENIQQLWAKFDLGDFEGERLITRKELSVVLDKIAHPFRIPVTIKGIFINPEPE